MQTTIYACAEYKTTYKLFESNTVILLCLSLFKTIACVGEYPIIIQTSDGEGFVKANHRWISEILWQKNLFSQTNQNWLIQADRQTDG